MASDEEKQEGGPAKKARLHYGSLEEVMRQRTETGSSATTAIVEGIRAGNINFSTAQPMIQENQIDESEKLGILAEFERKRKMRELAVPTDDLAVRARLRELGEPMTLFAEDKGLRRDRLKELYSKLAEGGMLPEREAPSSDEEEQPKEVWYHQGSKELGVARLEIAAYSLPRARERLEREKEAKAAVGKMIGGIQELHTRMKGFSNHSSQIGGDRPVACCSFSPDGKLLATADWTGLCGLWEMPTSKPVRKLRGHNDRASHIVFHPQATLSQSPTALNMASCSADGVVCLWDLQNETPIGRLKDHGDRVGRVAFHPSGKYLASTCFDGSWRLWDTSTQVELLHQEGHSRGVFGLAFQRDGALLATTGLDAHGMLWDLRTGRCIWTMQGHVKQVLAVDFAPDGHYVATGADDHQVKIWELRTRRCLYTIPAHTNLISAVKFEPTSGRYLVSASYDQTVKVWCHPQWSPLRTLQGHEGKILSVDINPEGTMFATSGFDRTFKLWAHGL